MKKIVNILIIVLILIIGSGFVIRATLFPIKDKGALEKYAKEYNVKPELVAAVINFESNFKNIEYSNSEPSGLMKLTPKTGEELAKEMGLKNFKVEDIANEDTSIRLGTYYLSKSNGENIKEVVGNWAIRNGQDTQIDMKAYAEQYYTSKIENRAKIYKVLYFMF